MQLFELKPCFW